MLDQEYYLNMQHQKKDDVYDVTWFEFTAPLYKLLCLLETRQCDSTKVFNVRGIIELQEELWNKLLEFTLKDTLDSIVEHPLFTPQWSDLCVIANTMLQHLDIVPESKFELTLVIENMKLNENKERLLNKEFNVCCPSLDKSLYDEEYLRNWFKQTINQKPMFFEIQELLERIDTLVKRYRRVVQYLVSNELPFLLHKLGFTPEQVKLLASSL